MVESAFKKSPSPKKLDKDDINNDKYKKEDDDIDNAKEIENSENNSSKDKVIKKENDNYEHEEGSLGEDEINE